MRYYVTADIHGFYTPLKEALTKVGFFEDTPPHKLVVLGDLMDRGKEAVEIQAFILKLMEADSVILIRGNHEDLYESLVGEDHGTAYSHHKHNGTYDTVLQLTGFDKTMAYIKRYDFADAGKETPFYQTTTGRTIQRWEHEVLLENVALETTAHSEVYKQRRCIVEHPFGTVKRHLGYTYFNRRGIENVNAETASMFIAYNLKRLFGMFKTQELIQKLQMSRS